MRPHPRGRRVAADRQPPPLGALRGGLVEREQRGRWAYYRLRPEPLKLVAEALVPRASHRRSPDGPHHHGYDASIVHQPWQATVRAEGGRGWI